MLRRRLARSRSISPTFQHAPHMASAAVTGADWRAWGGKNRILVSLQRVVLIASCVMRRGKCEGEGKGGWIVCERVVERERCVLWATSGRWANCLVGHGRRAAWVVAATAAATEQVL